MSLADTIAPGPTGPQHTPARKAYPDGWQPRMEVDDTDGGFVVSKPQPVAQATDSDHAATLAEFGLDPAAWSIERVRRSRWQRYDGEWLESARLHIVPARATAAAKVDLDALCRDIGKWRPRTTNSGTTGTGSFVAPLGDTQIGKVDGGGTTAAVPRILAEIERGATRYRHINRRSHFAQVILPQLGDCIEGTVSQGGAIVGRTDLGLTEMVRVYRRLLWAQVRTYATLAPKVLVPVVPGNHDEARRVPMTTHTDSWAIEAASAVMDAIRENPDLRDRVNFVFPEHDELTITIDATGTTLGMAHGHQFGRDPLRWWSEQAGGRSPIGDADVLLSGHFHHLRVQDHGGRRLWVQVPALDGGSTWFRHRHGQDSPSRAVTFWTENGRVYDLDPVL